MHTRITGILGAVVLVIAPLMLPVVAPARAADTPTVELTLVSTLPGDVSGSPATAAYYASTANGWTITPSLNHGVAVTVQKGNHYFHLELDPQSARAGGTRTAEVYFGAGCGGSSPNGRVLDRQVDPAGNVTRLDLVFAVNCGVSDQSDFLIGELRVNEPQTSAMTSDPTRVLWPPVNRYSDSRELPIRYTVPDGSASQDVASVRITGRDSRYFRIVHDSCRGAELAPAQHCTLRVEYTPHALQDLAAVELRAGDGRLLGRTPLSAGDLPGADYWGSCQPVSQTGTARICDTVHQPHGAVAAFLGDARAVRLLLNKPHEPQLGDFALTAASALDPRVTYPVGGFADQSAEFSWDHAEYEKLVGAVRVIRSDVFVERHLFKIPEAAVSFEFEPDGYAAPIDGAVGSHTGVPMKIPGLYRPPQVAAVTHARTGAAVRFDWAVSPDLAVHSYVARAEPGDVASVPIDKGSGVYEGPDPTFEFSPSSRPTTVEIYAVDNAGHHSQGHRIVLR